MNNTDMKRRTALAGLAAAALVPVIAGPAGAAVSTSTSETLVKKLTADITKVINSGKSSSALYSEFEKIFKRYADVSIIARSSLGAAARSASSSDLKAYTSAYTGYISRKYGARFNEFVGGTIEVQRARTEKSYVVVESTAKLRGKSPFKVDFLVSDRSGSAKFFNVIIEGINMLTTERTEIGAMLDKQGGSIPKLTAALKKA